MSNKITGKMSNEKKTIIAEMVCRAIANLRDPKGSTEKQIRNYIVNEYKIPDTTVKQYLKTALQCGVAFGCIHKKGGHFLLSQLVDNISKISNKRRMNKLADNISKISNKRRLKRQVNTRQTPKRGVRRSTPKRGKMAKLSRSSNRHRKNTCCNDKNICQGDEPGVVLRKDQNSYNAFDDYSNDDDYDNDNKGSQGHVSSSDDDVEDEEIEADDVEEYDDDDDDAAEENNDFDGVD